MTRPTLEQNARRLHENLTEFLYSYGPEPRGQDEDAPQTTQAPHRQAGERPIPSPGKERPDRADAHEKAEVTSSADMIMRLYVAMLASCTCGTKAPDAGFHDPTCRYRVLCDAVARIELQDRQLGEAMRLLTVAETLMRKRREPPWITTVAKALERARDRLNFLSSGDQGSLFRNMANRRIADRCNDALIAMLDLRPPTGGSGVSRQRL